ncbi:alpha/beta hydrolase family protein [Tahibacter caeni]|uniref:alpha/beta hydrolase family protein n=1 Tax=Tahibacter caeni TaxID=1453545 RepID=UPI002149151C|nr:alpha/beta fold hydrolase [Tahibacter caeni]
MTIRFGGRCSAMLLALLFGTAAVRAADTDKPLDADEGWAVIAIDNGIGASSVVIDGPRMRDDLARGLQPGANLRVLRLRAGTYRWMRANLQGSWSADRWYDIKRDKRFEFTIEPGVINYPGDLRLRGGFGYATFQRTNRALQAMMRLDKDHPGLREHYQWRSEVGAPDPFPAFAAELLPAAGNAALQASSDADAAKWRSAEIDQRFSDLFGDLFAESRVGDVRLSPDGSLLAFQERRAKGHAVVVVDIDSGQSLDALVVEGDIEQLLWGGNRSLYVNYASTLANVLAGLPANVRVVKSSAVSAGGLRVLRFGDGALSAKNITRLDVPGALRVNDPLPDSSRGLVWYGDSKGDAHLFAVDENAARIDIKNFRPELREDRGLERAAAVFADRSGELRAAIVLQDGERRALAVRDGSNWAVKAALPENIELRPVMLSADASHLLVLTNHERAQTELVKLMLDSGQLGETVFAMPGADLINVIQRSRDQAVIGVRYYGDGVLRERYFDDAKDPALAAVAGKFPGADVYRVDDSRDGRRDLLLVMSETERSAYYLFDRTTKKVEKLVDSYDAFRHARPVAARTFSVKTADGLTVQAFLTLPATGGGKAPLIVMPHGGPIGVYDTRYFDPTVQMLAGSGWAVLRVNYRGSGGAGRAFSEAGEGRWGREIEADVDLAVSHALENFALDPQRIALVGHSYGGYSTLMGLINKPERYRCGVAVAAVTDLPLMFSSADFTASERVTARMKKIMGDPDTQMDMLKENSPVYQYKRLQRPLLLIHGTEDERVTYEHAWRLRNLLASAGRAPSWLPVPGGDHSLARPKDELAVRAASDIFLKRCFAAEAAP